VGSRLHATSDGAPVAWDLAASSAPAQTVRLDKRSRRQDASTKWSPEARRLSCSDAVVACTRALLHATMLDSMIHRRPVPLYRVGDSAGPRARGGLGHSRTQSTTPQLTLLRWQLGDRLGHMLYLLRSLALARPSSTDTTMRPAATSSNSRALGRLASRPDTNHTAQVGPTPTTRLTINYLA
jgi:hypothetical protein